MKRPTQRNTIDGFNPAISIQHYTTQCSSLPLPTAPNKLQTPRGRAGFPQHTKQPSQYLIHQVPGRAPVPVLRQERRPEAHRPSPGDRLGDQHAADGARRAAREPVRLRQRLRDCAQQVPAFVCVWGVGGAPCMYAGQASGGKNTKNKKFICRRQYSRQQYHGILCSLSCERKWCVFSPLTLCVWCWNMIPLLRSM